MTHSKPVKKKKVKIGKDKKNDKEAETKQPPVPVDKRIEAEINLREMIKQAHKIHKDYIIRSNTGSLRVIPSKISRRSNDKSKSSANSSHDIRSMIKENLRKINKTFKENNKSITEVVASNSSRKVLQEVATKRKFSEESQRNQPITDRRSPDTFQVKEEDITAFKQDSARYQNKKETTKIIMEQQRQCNGTIGGYHAGARPFVSLELLDKMKCNDSNMSIYRKKRVLPQKRRTEDRQSSTNLPKTKTRKSEGKGKIIEDGVNDKEIKNHGITAAKKRKNTNTANGTADSELMSVPAESLSKKSVNRKSKAKSVVSSPKSVTSNLDSNLSTFVGAGDPFSSNTSHSYFSSDSEISKIDKKFMEILEAITKNKLNIDLDVKPQEKAFSIEEPKRENDSDKNGFEEFEPNQLEQKLIRRIDSLERKLNNTKSNTRSVDKKENGQDKVCDSINTAEIASPVVEQLWIKENTFRDEYSGVSLAINADQNVKENLTQKSFSGFKKEDGSEIRKICDSYKHLEKEDHNRKVECDEKAGTAASRENLTSSPEEGCKEALKSSKSVEKEVIKKGTMDSEVKSATTSKGKNETADTSGQKYRSKPIETWSIVKRLEKAFQTLGLSFEDLESSDEQVSAKKKQTLLKKRESFGKGKKNSHKIETLKGVPDEEDNYLSSKSRSADRIQTGASEEIQYGVESNGSGDKNMDYKKVRASKKVENLKGVSREIKDKVNKSVCYTSVNRRFQRKDADEPTVNLSKSSEVTLPKKRHNGHEMSGSRIESNITGMMVKNEFAERFATDWVSQKKLKREKHQRNIHVDDSLLGRRSTKRKSEYSLSASCSLSSMSEEDEFKSHKRKKTSPLYFGVQNSSNEDLWKVNTSGTGDATQAIVQLPGRSIDREIWHTTKNRPLNSALPRTQELLKMEERNNELELKQIRERHKQIISEIKTSLNEIKKQHNLVSQLRIQTKKFHKDCHVKRKLIAAYLKDVEETYEKRKTRRPFCETNCKHKRALSTDSYSYKVRRSNLKSKTSDFELEMVRMKKDEMSRSKKKLRRDPSWRNGCYESFLSIIATGNETPSDEITSIVLENTSTDIPSSDSAEESFRTVATSLKPVRRKIRKYSPEKTKKPQPLCLEWNKVIEKPVWQENIKQVPGYLVQLLEKLNKIILTEKDQLEDLVIKASASSNNSSYSRKTKASASSNSSGRGTPRRQNSRMEEVNRATSTGYKTSTSNSSGTRGSRQHKSKSQGNKKKIGRDKFEDVDDELALTRSRSFIQGDPGGSSADSIIDREQEIVISESFPNPNQTDLDTPCPASCSHFERQEEELRYRKGDPSFRFRGHLLKFLGEHSRHCRRKTPEEERALRRKMELERILRLDEKNSKRPTFFSRDSDGHALDIDSYNSGKGKHSGLARHRQQSIIIDHNRGEENEESQTVLGHASRHSGVGRSRKAPHEYLKVDMKSESSFQTRSQEIWKTSGKRHHLEEVPVNYFEISLNNPGCSAGVSRDADCQTDKVDDYDDVGDIYLWDETGSNHSAN